jgi:GH43 family beta-xylosidase
MNALEMWCVYHGVILDAVFETEEKAKEYALWNQKCHDLAGSSSLFSYRKEVFLPYKQEYLGED